MRGMDRAVKRNDGAPPSDRDERYRQIAQQVETLARANFATPLTVSQICQSIGASQRTVSRAFRVIHGTTPHGYLHVLRLNGVRQALLESNSPTRTVTEIAMHFGFRELGRFAADYRHAFGESPSQTLRREVD
jgi:AraC family ethanolamine operon transcriptional activator